MVTRRRPSIAVPGLFLALFLTGPAFADPGTEMGVDDDLSVFGVAGTASDPDVEIKGFTVFGSTQTGYTGSVAGAGNVVVNGVLAVSSGAYFVGNSTFTNANKIFINDGSAGQILSRNSGGYLQWTDSSAMGDNLGSHVATTTLDMGTFNIVNVSSVNFRSNVYLTSATAAQRGGVYVSTHLYVAGISSATSYYGDGSTLAGVSTDTLKIGDSYGGGIVFWVDAKGRNALISATADQSASIVWTPTDGFTGASLDGVYAGKANTVMISTMTGPGSYAARLCQDYAVTVGGIYYDDWYLPSSTELQLLYAQKTVVGGFTAGYYWSSNEYVPNTTYAWYVGFNFGPVGYTTKTDNLYVRCVRGGPVSAFDHSRDAETVRNGAYVNATQTFSGANTFTQGVTASSYTATGIGVQAAQLRLADAAGVVISSEAAAALGAGVRVSTNVYIVGFASATKFFGDGSSLTGLTGAADNLGSHVATTTLDMGTFNIVNVSSVNFRSNVYLTSATAAQRGGVYVSTHLYVAGISSATSYYGDGSTLAGVSTDTLKIGDSYGGGIVFWVDAKGRNALIAPTADQSAGIPWAPTTRFTGAQLDGVGAGKANTVMVTTTTGPGSYAARLCQDYAVTVGGVYYDDWYLPSLAELQLLYAQKTVVGGFASTAYWSSTEYVPNATDALDVNFVNGGVSSDIKTYGIFVRCVRGGPFSAFDHSRDAETVRNGAYITSTQTFTGGNTFALGVTASSYTATGIGVQAAQLRLADAAGVVISSEAAAALGAGVRVSTNVYIVGFASATKFFGDGSSLTGLTAAGDNLGNHVATTTLNMAGFQIKNVSSMTIIAPDSIASSLWVSTSAVTPHLYVSTAGKVGIGTAGPVGKLSIDLTNTDYTNTAGAGSHLMMSNPSATGQNVVYSAINGNLVAKWRTDYAGNINWISGRAGGKHYFFTGGDYGTGKIRMVLPDDGSAYIGGDIAEVTWANASLAIKNGNVGISTGAPQARLDVLAGGSTPADMAQIWRKSAGVIVGSMSATGVMMATKFVGDASGMTGTGDNLGNHIATTTLQMGAYGVNTSSNITAARYQINGSTMVAILPGIDSIAYGVSAGASNITGGDYNVFIGNYAGASNTTGAQNTANGNLALYSNTTGSNNTANGSLALYFNTTGSNNTANGYYALYSNTTGSQNIANGVQALYSNTTGNFNTANGTEALLANTGGSYNTANGYGAINSNTTGDSNTANGMEALFFNTTGGNNTVNGLQALYYNETGSANSVFGVNAGGYGAGAVNSFSSSTVMGYQAGYNLTTGGDNTFLGWQAGYNVTTGTGNIIIGYDQRTPAVNSNNFLNIGGVLYGDLAAKTIGISTGNPQAALDIVSTGTLINQYAQIWRASNGTIVSSMTATGVLYPAVPATDNTKVAKTGDTMTGQLTLNGSSLTVTGNGGNYGLQVSSGVSLSGLLYTNNGTVSITGQLLNIDDSDNGDVMVKVKAGAYTSAKRARISLSGGYGDTGTTEGFYIDSQASGAAGFVGNSLIISRNMTNQADAEAMRINSDGYVGISTGAPQARLDVLAAGSAATDMAQIWRKSDGVIVGSMSATGVLMATKFVGDASGMTGTSDNLGSHVATTTLNMASWNLVNVSSVNFRSGVFLTSATAANYGGVYVSTHIYTPGSIYAGALYGDGSGLIGIAARTYVARSLAAAANSYIYIGNFSVTNGAHNLYVAVTVSAAGFSVAKQYALPIYNNMTGASWNVALPIANTGPGTSGDDFALEVNVSGATATLRLRRTAGSAAGTALVSMETIGPSADIFTSDSTTGTDAAAYPLLAVTAITQVGGNIGISAGAPQARMDMVAAGASDTDYLHIWRNSSGVIVASMTSTGKIFANLSAAGTGDNLGNHTATTQLKLGNYAVWSSSSITAARYQINGSTVLAILPGVESIAVGPNTGSVNTGNYSVFVGSGAGAANTTGAQDTFVGHSAGYSNAGGAQNTFVGYAAGYKNAGAWYNTFLGVNAGYNNISGQNNTFLGNGAGLNNTGGNNTYLGYYAGSNGQGGGGNIVIGYNQALSAPAAGNELNIGGVLYGDLAAKTIGISTRVPQAALDIVSTGTAANIYAQIWRNGSGTIVSSMTSQGVLYPAQSGDNLGTHIATQTLNMAGFGVVNVASITATNFIRTSTLTVIAPNTLASSLWVSTSAVTPHLYVSTNGNVGIGTTGPARRLHVAGTEGMRLAASALPGSPAAGDIAIDSGDSNRLKWYDGSSWLTAGSGVPMGTIALFSGVCPTGWSEYGGTQGRTVVGMPGGGMMEGTVGSALANLGSRTIDSVAAHTHTVDPPSTASGIQSVGHTHYVDPPATASGIESAGHTHSIDPPNTGVSIFDSGHGHEFNYDGPGSGGSGLSLTEGDSIAGGQIRFSATGITASVDIGSFVSGSVSANHTHSTDIGSFASAAQSADHAHATDIAQFGSGSAGAASVDVTMPYVQLRFCQKTADDTAGTASAIGMSGGNVFVLNTANNFAIGATDAGANKLYVNGDGTVTGNLTVNGTITGTVSGNVNANQVNAGSFQNAAYTFPNAVNFPGSGIWNASGNVGIGAADPQTNLEVYKYTGTWDTGPEIYLTAAQTGAYTAAKASIQGITPTASGHSGSGALVFKTANASSAGRVPALVERMRIMHDGNVGIGTPDPLAKLHVEGAVLIPGFSNAASVISFRSDIPAGTNVGIRAKNVGGTGNRDGLELLGYNGIDFTTNNGATVAMHISGVAQTNGNVGIGTTNPGYTLTVNGTAWVTSGAWSGSDRRWKKDISPLKDSLNKIMKLQGVGYNWRTEEFPELKFSTAPQVGLIAQDTEKIVPEAVTTDNNGYKGISYEKLVPVLIEAVKEQQKKIEELELKLMRH